MITTVPVLIMNSKLIRSKFCCANNVFNYGDCVDIQILSPKNFVAFVSSENKGNNLDTFAMHLYFCRYIKYMHE